MNLPHDAEQIESLGLYDWAEEVSLEARRRAADIREQEILEESSRQEEQKLNFEARRTKRRNKKPKNQH